jgi:hypothetical protein
LRRPFRRLQLNSEGDIFIDEYIDMDTSRFSNLS